MKPEELDSLSNNTFTLDCVNILLTQRSKTDNTGRKVHVGPGSITQSHAGRFQFKVYCNKPIDPQNVFSRFKYVPGVIIDDSEYYDLIATDIIGREWKAIRIFPFIKSNSSFKNYIVEGDFYELDSISDLGFSVKKSQIVIRYRGLINIPCNTHKKVETFINGEKRAIEGELNIAKFKNSDFEFEIEKGDNWLILTAISEKFTIPEYMAKRITEALQFVLGRTLNWSTIEIYNEQELLTKISGAPENKSEIKIWPPIHFSTVEKKGAVWNLFCRFLEYISSYKVDEWHPIFSLIYSIIESGGASLEAKALTLSVSVESLLNSVFPLLASPDKNIKDEINRAKQLISVSDLNSTLKTRLDGSLSTMLSPRAKDKLFILRDHGIIEEALIVAWDELRNKTAHGHIIEYREIEKYIKLCDHALTLFYKLIFLTVVYSGIYTDYSSSGYSMKNFECSFEKTKLFRGEYIARGPNDEPASEL